MTDITLKGKITIVTGGASQIGLGKAMAIAMVKAGARVSIIDINEEWLETTGDYIRNIAGKENVVTQFCDISDFHSARTAVANTIDIFDGLDILVNNAGIMGTNVEKKYSRTNFWDVSIDRWNNVMAVNANGVFNMVKASIGYMLQQRWGRIIGVTTSIDSMYKQGMCPYGPSKASHEALVALMASELENTGVTANVLIPGGTSDTNMIPLDIEIQRKDLIQPDIMGPPSVWLASEESKSINGHRFIAYNWDDTLPLEQRIEKASAPAAWPQLGNQAINPWT